MTVGSSRVAELLIRKGAAVNARSVNGSTALILHRGPDIVRVLLENGADVNLRNNDGVTALIAAVRGKDPLSAKLLIARGADVNAVTKGGDTPMKIGAREGEIGIGDLLRQAGAK